MYYWKEKEKPNNKDLKFNIKSNKQDKFKTNSKRY